MRIEVGYLFFGILDVVIGNEHRLYDVAFKLAVELFRLFVLLYGLLDIFLVEAAVIEVPVEHQLDEGFVLAPLRAVVVIVQVGPRAHVDLRAHTRGLLADDVAHRLRVLRVRYELIVARERRLSPLLRQRRKGDVDRVILKVGRRRFADDTRVLRFGVVQVALLRYEVDPRERDASICRVVVHRAVDARLRAFLDLFQDLLVACQVPLRKRHQFAVADDILMRAEGGVADLLHRGEQIEVTHVLRVFIAFYGAVREVAVVYRLGRDGGKSVIVVVVHISCRIAVTVAVEVVASDAGVDVELWPVAGIGALKIVARGPVGVQFSLYLGITFQRALDRLPYRDCLAFVRRRDGREE